MSSEQSIKIENSLNDIAHLTAEKYHMAVEELTMEQVQKIMVEMMKSGDFTRYVYKDPRYLYDRQGVCYMPYSEANRLSRMLDEAMEFIESTDNLEAFREYQAMGER